MIATGGTGGHIYPALAFAEILKQKYSDIEIVFLGTDNRMEKDIIPSKGYRFIGMHMSGMNGGIGAKISSAFSLLKAQNKCAKLLKQEKPDACIGFGNYISVPLILAASRYHIPTMIHEQNSFAGKANVMLGKYADAIVLSSNGPLKQFPSAKTRVYGNPEATIASSKDFDKNKLKEYGINPEEPYILFMMGSLGSSSVAKVIDESLGGINENVQILVVHGKANEYVFKTQENDRIHIVPYVDGLTTLKYAKLAICRAGATTLSEIMALGVASILVPSPYVPNNHQYYNAMEIAENGGAMIIEEKDLNAKVLCDTINTLLDDDDKLSFMRSKAKKEEYNDAAYKMISWLEDLQ